MHQLNTVSGSNFLTFADAQTLATAYSKADVALWNIATGQKIRQFTGHEAPVVSFAFSPDGKLALSGSMDNTLILWNAVTGELVHRYTEHSTRVWQVTFSPDQKIFMSASNGIILWWADPITLSEIRMWIEANRYLPPDAN